MIVLINALIVPEQTAMKLTGRRDAQRVRPLEIVNEADLRSAVSKLADLPLRKCKRRA
jgi:hypothetical protein